MLTSCRGVPTVRSAGPGLTRWARVHTGAPASTSWLRRGGELRRGLFLGLAPCGVARRPLAGRPRSRWRRVGGLAVLSTSEASTDNGVGPVRRSASRWRPWAAWSPALAIAGDGRTYRLPGRPFAAVGARRRGRPPAAAVGRCHRRRLVAAVRGARGAAGSCVGGVLHDRPGRAGGAAPDAGGTSVGVLAAAVLLTCASPAPTR